MTTSDDEHDRSTGSSQHHSHAVSLDAAHLSMRTFLLGDDAGFVLYEPVAQNVHDATLLPIKWFGASGFGHKYFEANRVWLDLGGRRVKLDRSNQTGFIQELDRAVRIFSVDGCAVRQTFFAPNRQRAFVMTLEADGDARFVVEPQFDMRYYQSFNTDFGQYAAKSASGSDGPALHVSNHVSPPDATGRLDFYCVIRSLSGGVDIQLLPEGKRLRHKTYLKDERRDKLIHSAYAETMEAVPDEAPIWDMYSTTIYAPAEIAGSSPLTLIYAFGARAAEAEPCAQTIHAGLPALARDKTAATERRLQQGALSTGDEDVDRAYAQVFTRFNAGLVARDMTIDAGSGQEVKNFSAIFAGNKYFLDAWKRDENISLGGLLLTGDYGTVRAILDNTWQFQDQRTGRLPHIIRLGEPLVYYSSDGTLWALRRLHEYTRASGDGSLLEAKYDMVEHFFAASMRFVQRGLLPSGGIIDKAYLWETWEDTPYTPRDGFPVEIELLWLTALANFLPTIGERNPELAKRLRAALEEGRETFKLFHLDGYLADSLSYSWQPRELLTPNGYIAFGLDFPLPPDLQRHMVLLGREQLAGLRGVRGLAWRDWPKVLSPQFLDDPRNVQHDHMASVGIYNYHRGIEWLWLNQFFVRGELTCGDTEHAYADYVNGLVHAALHESGVGGLGELYDLRGPLGADFQAWSMAGFLGCLHAFVGVEVDAVERCVHVRPSLPQRFPRLECRRQVGDTRFDVRATGAAQGSQSVEVHAVDPVPADSTLRLGVRFPPGKAPGSVTLNGRPVSRDQWKMEPGRSREVGEEIWIETPFLPNVAVRFVIGG